MNYAERIRELRKEKGYTQTYVAKSIHVAQTTYSDYENSRLRISIKHLVELARFYDVDMDFITGVSDARKAFPQK